MNVLFWVNTFPNYSETFIRDQVVHLLKNKITVTIFSSRGKNRDQLEALKGFESYSLLNRSFDESDILPKTWRARKIFVNWILFWSFFGNNHKFYKKALRYKNLDLFPKAYHVFFYVHFLLKNKIQVIHAHYANNGMQASIFKELGLPIKLIVSFHGYDLRLGLKKPKGYFNELFARCNKVIAISNYSKKHLLEFGLQKHKLIVLPNGIDTNFYKRIGNDGDSNGVQILSVGRLVEEKGFNLAIKAVASYHDKYPEQNIHYKIIGDGAMMNNLQELIDTLQATKYIRLEGYKNTLEVKQAMQNADFYLLSSVAEVLPTVLLEAQSCELPILATNVGAVNEMLGHGIVVAPNKLDDLIDGLEKMFDQKESWSIMGVHGRNFVKESYNIQHHIEKLIELYRE